MKKRGAEFKNLSLQHTEFTFHQSYRLRECDRVIGQTNPILFVDPFGLDWVSTTLGTLSFGLNTVGLATANPFVKFAGITVSSAAIAYSAIQRSNGNMSANEALRNQALAVADIVGASLGGRAGIAVTVGSRALGAVNTIHDGVTSSTQVSNVSSTSHSLSSSNTSLTNQSK